MPSAAILRRQIESALSQRIPSALTPLPPMVRPVVPTGIDAVDDLLQGGLPLGALTEIVGPECSGRTALALSFLPRITGEGKVCAWIDVSDSLHPESAAAVGIDLERLLWVRCGVPKNIKQPSPQNSFTLPEKYLIPAPIKKGLHGGGFGPHPRNEGKNLAEALNGLLGVQAVVPQCAEPPRPEHSPKQIFEPVPFKSSERQTKSEFQRPLSRIDQALRVTDLLLQAGGFGAIVLDMGSIAPDHTSRVPLATWFRYRAAAERTQACVLLLTQYPCAKSSAGLVLRMQPGNPIQDEQTIFTGISHQVEIARERFAPPPSNVIPLRKPPQSERVANWRSRTAWTAR